MNLFVCVLNSVREMYEAKDSYEQQKVTFPQIVAMSGDCLSTCEQRSTRTLTNNSRALKGKEEDYSKYALERKAQEMRQCMEVCSLVKSSCPDTKVVEQHEAYEERLFAARSSKKMETRAVVNEKPVIDAQQLSRCEHAVEILVKTFFSMAHKPTKVHFDIVDPKTGQKMGGNDTGDSKISELKFYNDMSRRLSQRPASLEMSDEKVPAQEMVTPLTDSRAAGTTPKW